MKTILLIEDMQGVRDSLEMLLSTAGYKVTLATNGQEGLQSIAASTHDLIITDILMPEVDGSEVIMSAKKTHPDTLILAISAGGNGVSADQALMLAKEKADAVLEKPFSKDDFLSKVKELVG